MLEKIPKSLAGFGIFVVLLKVLFLLLFSWKIFGWKYYFYYLCNVKQLNIHQMKRYKVIEVIRLLQADGWIEMKSKATDHRQFKHPTKPGKVTVRGHKNEVLSQFLLNSIWKQAGWK